MKKSLIILCSLLLAGLPARGQEARPHAIGSQEPVAADVAFRITLPEIVVVAPAASAYRRNPASRMKLLPAVPAGPNRVSRPLPPANRTQPALTPAVEPAPADE